MRAPREIPRCDAEGHCITCSDEGVVLRVVALGEDGMAVCEAPDGGRTDVPVDLTPGTAVGDHLLVHAGVALQRIDPESGAIA